MQCPFCKEEILDGAIKCKHCGSMIGEYPAHRRPPQVDFAEQLRIAARIWKANLADLALLTLVFMVVVWIPIVNIGFIAGYTRSILKVARGQGKARVGDLFDAWDCFGNLFLFFLINLIVAVVLHAVPFLGSLASIAWGFVVFPGAFVIIDKGTGTVDAFKWSWETILADLPNWLLAYIVGNLVIFGGMLVFLIGIIFTAPLGQLIFMQQYERMKPGVG